MIAPAMRIALAAVFFLAGDAVARGAPCEPLPRTFDYAAYADEIRLDLHQMVSLPPRTVVLAGAFRDPGNTVHPALLTSQDGGETWSTTRLPVHGAGLGHLVSDGVVSAWGIVSVMQEGVDDPLYLMRSRDAGRTWCAIPRDGLDTLAGVELFRMFDVRHGLMVFSEAPFGGGYHAYQTHDGGESWLPLWRAAGTPPDEADAEADYPGRPLPPPPHATLWRSEAGFLAAHAVVRLRRDDDGYAVERYDVSGDGSWRPLSRIARAYRVVDGALVPVP